MIEFLTLFLGLVAGPQEVALAIREPVARVELYLDGERVAVSTGEPWRARIDLGPALLPHELEAVALGADGAFLGRRRQRLNVPRSPAEISLLLERDAAGRPTGARLAWESRLAGGPLAVRAWLDGTRLEQVSAERIVLPPSTADDFHLLEVELEFAAGVTARGELGFGGYLGSAGTELTAVVVRLAEQGATLEPAAMASWFVAEEKTVAVRAVETGSAEVVLVRDLTAAAALRDLPGSPGITASGRMPGLRAARLRKAFAAGLLGEDQRLRLLYPVPRRATGHEMTHEVFSLTPLVDAEEGGIYWHAAAQLAVEEGAATRLADAVAVAGNQAATGGNRRIVLLLLGPGSADRDSRYQPLEVRRYLEALRVPLEVWYLGRARKAPRDWGEPKVVSSFHQFEEAVEALRQRLARQRVVWIEGAHLASAVRLAPGVTAIELAR